MEAIKASHFACSFYKKQNMSSMSQKTVPTTRQTMTRPFCCHLMKALLNQQLLCQVTHPALKASVSSITAVPTGALATWNYKHSYRRLCFCEPKNTSLQGRTILPTLEYCNSNLYTSTNVSTLITKKRGILTSLTLYMNFCHFHKLWGVSLWLLCVILCN